MASNTKKTEGTRLRKGYKTGRKRKKLLEREGTTKSEVQLFGGKLAR